MGLILAKFALVGLTSGRGANSKQERDGNVSKFTAVADANRARATERKRENKR